MLGACFLDCISWAVIEVGDENAHQHSTGKDFCTFVAVLSTSCPGVPSWKVGQSVYDLGEDLLWRWSYCFPVVCLRKGELFEIRLLLTMKGVLEIFVAASRCVVFGIAVALVSCFLNSY